MNRREFIATGITGTAVLPAAAEPAEADVKSRMKTRMKAGNQHRHDAASLRTLAAFGINHICSGLPSSKFDAKWSVDSLTQLREQCEKFGIKLEMVPIPMSSLPIETLEEPNILLGKSPERDREIDQICQMIENCAKAGITAVKYNLTLLGVVRTESTPGRGGAAYSTFVYDKAKKDTLTAAGHVTEAALWERITYFLKRVVPVAEANKVRI